MSFPTLPRPALRSDSLALIAGVFFAALCNFPFWSALLTGRDAAALDTWRLLGGTFVLVAALHTFLLLLVLNRWTAKPLLILLALTLAPAVYFMSTYSVYMDPAMVRNVLGTDPHETSELLSPWMVLWLLGYAVLPILFIWRVQIPRDAWWPALRRRAIALLLVLATIGASVWTVMDILVPVMREDKAMRFLITPGNYLVSLSSILGSDARAATKPRAVVGEDAKLAARAPNRKPIVLVLVVGETVRAANWGLNGYARQTTPELAARHPISFLDVTSCGTNTETSVPCMFSVQGRRHYNEDIIRNSESLLNVVSRAGIDVLWRDNQSGCKGVCKGVASESVFRSEDPRFCADGRCMDAILIDGLRERLASTPGDLLLVLHMLGNHGPAYYQRYPQEFRRWTPTCDTTDIGSCPRDALVNTYDNAILYTDHVLASAIDVLAADTAHDTALLYVSDHGESLGENNLYLHSLPRMIAPAFQTHVPMTLWLSPGMKHALGINDACLAERAIKPASHDNLFHTTLGIFGVETTVLDSSMDLLAGCRH